MAYTYQEFPRVVYGPDNTSRTISSEDERPEGFVNSPAELLNAAVEDAAEAESALKLAEKDLRDGYKDFLDRNNVVYAKNLGTAKLAELVAQLEDHLSNVPEPANDYRE